MTTPSVTSGIVTRRFVTEVDAVSGTPRAQVPAWWAKAPQVVAEALCALPQSGNRTVLYLAVAGYSAVAAEVYMERVAHRLHRLRPSASTELEPSRLLRTHAADNDWRAAAYFFCSAHDVADAVSAARTCRHDSAVVQIECDWYRFAVHAMAQSSGPYRREPDVTSLPDIPHATRRSQ